MVRDGPGLGGPGATHRRQREDAVVPGGRASCRARRGGRSGGAADRVFRDRHFADSPGIHGGPLGDPGTGRLHRGDLDPGPGRRRDQTMASEPHSDHSRARRDLVDADPLDVREQSATTAAALGASTGRFSAPAASVAAA